MVSLTFEALGLFPPDAILADCFRTPWKGLRDDLVPPAKSSRCWGLWQKKGREGGRKEGKKTEQNRLWVWTKSHSKEENVWNCAIYILVPLRSTEPTGEVRQTVMVTSEDRQLPLAECPRLSSWNKFMTKIHKLYLSIVQVKLCMETVFNFSSCQLKPGESLLTFVLNANVLQVSGWQKEKLSMDAVYRGDDVQSNTHRGPIRGAVDTRAFTRVQQETLQALKAWRVTSKC